MTLYTVLMGMRAALKEDLGISPYQLMFGTAMRIPGDLFSSSDTPPPEPGNFVQQLARHFRDLKPIPTTHHTRVKKPFIHKDLGSCSHVFRRIDAVKPPLTPPYAGPYRVIKRLDARRFVVDVEGVEKTLSTEYLKPAYLSARDMDGRSPAPPKRVTFAPKTAAQPALQARPAQRGTVQPASTPAQVIPPTRTSLTLTQPVAAAQSSPSPVPSAVPPSQLPSSSWTHNGVPTRGGVAVATGAGSMTSSNSARPACEGRMRHQRKQVLQSRNADAGLQFLTG